MNGEAETKANVRARATAIFMVTTTMNLGKSGLFLNLSLENRVMIESDERAYRSKSRHEGFYYFLKPALTTHAGVCPPRSPSPTSEE